MSRVVATLSAGALVIVSASAAPANVFVNGSGAVVREYNPTGSLVRTIPVPGAGGDTNDARGVVVDEAGRMHVFLSTFDPSLATHDPVTGTWSHRTHPGLSLVNNGSYGGITALGDYVYVPDMTTFGAGDTANGIVRFNLADNTSTRFAEGGFEFINLARGYDGLLYALGTGGSTEGRRVRVYDPITMDLVRDVSLAAEVRGIVADATGNMYGGSWGGQIFKFSPTGQALDSLTPGGSFSDIDMARDGTIVVGDWRGSVVYTDPSLDTFRRVEAAGGDSEFVAFTDPVPEPATVGLAVVAAGWFGLRRRR